MPREPLPIGAAVLRQPPRPGFRVWARRPCRALCNPRSLLLSPWPSCCSAPSATWLWPPPCLSSQGPWNSQVFCRGRAVPLLTPRAPRHNRESGSLCQGVKWAQRKLFPAPPHMPPTHEVSFLVLNLPFGQAGLGPLACPRPSRQVRGGGHWRACGRASRICLKRGNKKTKTNLGNLLFLNGVHL